MNNAITWQQWAQQLSAYIEMQKQRIDTLEQTVSQLQADLKSVRDEKRFHIDKIEYNFDQLKVEKLDGTLTIGISPSTIDQIEDFTVNGTSMNKDENGNSQAVGGDMNPFYQTRKGTGSGPAMPNRSNSAGQGKGIQDEVANGIEQYLQFGVQADMDSLEHKYGHPLDEEYKELIIEDIRKQLDTRIGHYVNQYRGVGFEEPLEAVTSSIMEKTKQDIITAIETYISSLPKS